MKRCIDLAKRAIGYVSPNPMVGSVIVYKGKIIGEGYHKVYGEEHAEVNAILSVKDKKLLQDSTLYVNLEPCSHFGKKPPCTNLIIKHKISKVVIGCIDSFPQVSGKGIASLRNAGIEVVVGVLEKESRFINKRFFSFHEKKKPFIILKWAQSKDGFIAPKDQKAPLWMTSKKSKAKVHQWRAEEDAILVGRITATKDDPQLNVRETKGKNPIRIVIDKKLKLSNKLHIFNSDVETIIFNSIKTDRIDSNYFIKINFNNLISNILKELYKLKIQSLIVEGGNITIQSFIDKNTWNEGRIFTTTKTLSEGVKSPNIKGETIFSEKIGSDKLEIILKA